MHKSVLLNEAIENLHIKEDGIYVDCTLGYGGHSKEILKRITRGCLFAFDQDQEAIAYSEKALAAINNHFEIINCNFVNLKSELMKRNITKVDGILFDLGVSSPQLDTKERGFSYHQDAKLDMRMDQTNPLSAYEVVNNYSYAELVKIFYQYGEEKYSTSIAKNIVKDRLIKPIETTFELVEIIKKSMPEKAKRGAHPARKIFQAIRIEVNNELEVFKTALEDAISLLNKNGRICVITFHSLEDHICKQIYRKYSEVDEKIKGLPFIPKEYEPILKIIEKKGFSPSEEELTDNNRARSSKLRVAERI